VIVLPTRADLIRFFFVTSGLILLLSLFNMPIAVLAAFSKDIPSLAKYRTALERYVFASLCICASSNVAFRVAGGLLKTVQLEEDDHRALISEASRQQVIKTGLIAQQCCDCKYFAGFASPVCCAVNPKGNPNECSDWRRVS
jgi:hypothetical protein